MVRLVMVDKRLVWVSNLEIIEKASRGVSCSDDQFWTLLGKLTYSMNFRIQQSPDR